MQSTPDDTGGERKAQVDPTVPDTRAPEPGTAPAAGRISPAEKAEPSGVPVQEHQHNADPNAPQTEVVPPGETQTSEKETGGIAASSLDQSPEVGSDKARRDEQVPNSPPPPDAGEGTSSQSNDPLESHPRSS
jgi:hypothetical protein